MKAGNVTKAIYSLATEVDTENEKIKNLVFSSLFCTKSRRFFMQKTEFSKKTLTFCAHRYIISVGALSEVIKCAAYRQTKIR